VLQCSYTVFRFCYHIVIDNSTCFYVFVIDCLSWGFTSHLTTKWVILEMLFPANILASTKKTKSKTRRNNYRNIQYLCSVSLGLFMHQKHKNTITWTKKTKTQVWSSLMTSGLEQNGSVLEGKDKWGLCYLKFRWVYTEINITYYRKLLKFA